MASFVMPLGFVAVTPRVTITVTQLTPVAQSGVALTEGYQVAVEPWVVAPDPSHVVTTMQFDFLAVLAVPAVTPIMNFTYVRVDFKRKNHFESPPVVYRGGRYILEETLAPPANQHLLAADLINPSNQNYQDYEYRIRFTLDLGAGQELEVEVDPGYRVWP